MHYRQTIFKKKEYDNREIEDEKDVEYKMMMNFYFYYRNNINKIILCAIIKALIVKHSSRKLRSVKI